MGDDRKEVRGIVPKILVDIDATAKECGSCELHSDDCCVTKSPITCLVYKNQYGEPIILKEKKGKLQRCARCLKSQVKPLKNVFIAQ